MALAFARLFGDPFDEIRLSAAAIQLRKSNLGLLLAIEPEHDFRGPADSVMKRDLLFALPRRQRFSTSGGLRFSCGSTASVSRRTARRRRNCWQRSCQRQRQANSGRILVETVILLSMPTEADSAKVLRDAAQAYKVDIEAITANVKQEFAAKEKAMSAKKPGPNRRRSRRRRLRLNYELV